MYPAVALAELRRDTCFTDSSYERTAAMVAVPVILHFRIQQPGLSSDLDANGFREFWDYSSRPLRCYIGFHARTFFWSVARRTID